MERLSDGFLRRLVSLEAAPVVRRHRRRRRFTGHRGRYSPSLEHPPPSPLLLPLGGSRDGRVNGEERTSVCPPLHDQPCLG